MGPFLPAFGRKPVYFGGAAEGERPSGERLPGLRKVVNVIINDSFDNLLRDGHPLTMMPPVDRENFDPTRFRHRP